MDRKEIKTVKYYAGTFGNLKEFYTIKDARKYCKELKKITTDEIRIVAKKDNKNILLN